MILFPDGRIDMAILGCKVYVGSISIYISGYMGNEQKPKLQTLLLLAPSGALIAIPTYY